MKILSKLTKRNVKMFFKDKGMFFVSLATPLILLGLYIIFLGSMYTDSYTKAMPEGVVLSENVLDGLVGAQLFSSLLAVCAVTVAFCSNMLMVNDGVSGAQNDLLITPLKKSKLAISYYLASFISTLLICVVTTFVCFVYLAIVGWYLSFIDVILIFLDILILVMFGTALSSVVNYFLTSQGQVSAVGSIVSAAYGFVCGAYMPISSYGTGIQKVLSFLPGTYGTSLIRNHAMRGAFKEMNAQGVPETVIEGLKSSIDCNVEFFGNSVSIGAMYAIMIVSVITLVSVYVLLNVLVAKKSVNKQKKNQG